MANLLLTGGRAPATLDLLRLLHRGGHRVFQADSLPYPLAGASRYAAGSFRLPKPAFEAEAFGKALRQIVDRQSIDLIIPTCEEVFYIAAARDELGTTVFTPDLETLRRLHSKWEFNQLLAELLLPCAQTLVFDPAPAGPPEAFFPAIVKPEFTRFGTAVKLVRDAKQWQDINRKSAPSTGRWLWQQYLEGEHWGTYSVVRAGQVRAHCTYRLQWRYGAQGAATFFEAADCPEIETQVKTMVGHLNYTGQIAFDFIRNAADGRFYAIECNPRATSGIHLFAPEDGLAEAFFGTAPAVIRPTGPARKLALPMLLAAPFSALWGRRFRRDWRSARDTVWNWKDPLPALEQTRLMAYWLYLARREKISLTEATTWDIAWNGI